MSIMSKLFCRDDIGIDLGGANMRVWIRGEGLVLEEPSAVALDISHEEVKEQGQQNTEHRGEPRKHRVLAIGAVAGDMLVNAIDFVREVKNAVDELCSDGICAGAVLTTHEMKCLDDVVGSGERRERVIDRVCVVHGVHKNDEVNCRVVFDGKAEDVWRQFFEDYKERTFANDGSSLFEQVKGVCEANATERRSHHA